MTLKTVLLIFIGIILLNRILDKLISLSEKKKKEKKEILHINVLKDFESLIVKYLEDKGYKNITKVSYGEITVYSEEGAILVKYKKMNEIEELINQEEIITFIANMNMKGFKKGIFLTNGVINTKIKDIIKNKFYKDVDLQVFDGINFIIELKKIKLKEDKIFFMKKEMI